MPPGFYTEEHYYPGYTEWVELQETQSHERSVDQLVRLFVLLNTKQQRCRFTNLPDDVITRILSHSDLTELNAASVLCHRMRQLVSEQQASASKTVYRLEYGEWELLYPEHQDLWSRAWSGDGSRKSFFDRLRIREENALAYFDHVQSHYGECLNSWGMQRLKAHASEIEFRSESEIRREPSILSPARIGPILEMRRIACLTSYLSLARSGANGSVELSVWFNLLVTDSPLSKRGKPRFCDFCRMRRSCHYSSYDS